MASKFPFAADSRAEATNDEIGLIFGPSGAIAKFFDTTIGPLVVRRGDSLSAKTWANMGVNIAPPVVASFPGWIAPLSAAGVATTAAVSSVDEQTMFALQALGTTGATEFTIEIDGQALRWRGQAQPYVNMVWPNPGGSPGSRITAIAPDGRTIVLLNEPGLNGLKKMVDAAKRKPLDKKVFELSWENSGVVVTANLKVIGKQRMPVVAAPPPGQGFKRMKLPDSIISTAAAPVAVAAAATTGAAQ